MDSLNPFISKLRGARGGGFRPCKKQDSESQLKENFKQNFHAKAEERLELEPEEKLQKPPVGLDPAREWRRSGRAADVEGTLQSGHVESRDRGAGLLQDPMQSPLRQKPGAAPGTDPECRELSEISGATEEGTGSRQKQGLCKAGHRWYRRVEVPLWTVVLILLPFCTATAVLIAKLAICENPASASKTAHLWPIGDSDASPGSKDHESSFEKCDPCPEGWLWYAGMCYYISTMTRSWVLSQEYCSTYNGTLAVLKRQQELTFVQHFKLNNYWVGLSKREDGLWWWVDGSPLQKEWFPFPNDGSSLGCAYIISEKFGALHCQSERLWLCTRAPSSCIMAQK
ncbi:CD209 antigen-like protein 2 isoform X2 [Rhinatrema bivittatum]|uniref:CD209 antigen-like protein 2 isoform X2 n=1 Tax=Rhinatrema bivittatum TaxID=194408 RepID=UPI0011288ED2|nr:CD209 antigen-like protein 2 isoform X2 [Rhinatrema bivittatum]